MAALSSSSSRSKNTIAVHSSRSHLFLVLFCAAYLASCTAAVSRNFSSDYPALSDSRHDHCFTVKLNTTAIYYVPAAGCPDICLSAEHRGSITPPYGGGDHFIGISATGVPEDDLTVEPPPPCWEKHRARHLPVDLESSKEKNTGTNTVRLVGRSPPALHFITTGLLSSDCSALVLENKTGVLCCSNSANLSFVIHGIAFSSRGGTGTGSPSIRRLLSGAYSRSAAKQHVAIHGKVASWSWKEKASVVGALAAASVLLGLLLCCIRKNRRGRSTAAIELEEDDDQSVLKPDLWRGLGPRQFRYSELVAATCNFAEERKLGRGGFGPVYRGYLSDQDRNVAIKVLSREQSEQGIKEFQAEVAVMSQLRHRHIVQLVGWCDSRTGLLLVYELMAGGSLDTQLYSPERLLTWSERYKIALGLGSALLYLHTDCDQCVVHGDIKPANVMLDALRNAKLGDFGLARLVDHGTELPTTQIVAGTVGYIDPEFVNNRRPRAESDVYSFGVVLLEIASGRRPASAQSNGASALLAWARGMYDRNMILDAADRRLNGEFDETQMERVLVTGLWCAHHDPSQRPSIAQAMDVLRSEDATLPVLLAMSGAEQIRSLEERAYGDLSAEGSASAHASTATPYLTCKYSTYLLAEE